MPDQNEAENVGQDKPYKDVVDKYDAEHGKYQTNVPPSPVNLPNASSAASDPSPFKLGPT